MTPEPTFPTAVTVEVPLAYWYASPAVWVAIAVVISLVLLALVWRRLHR
jgi:hypothetical protein